MNVSVIIPCYNEEKYIQKCIDSLIRQDFPKENLEILAVDGLSEDNTRSILEKYPVKVLENPKRTTPCAMNIGIKNSQGEVVIKADAHTIYPNDYISQCLKYMDEYGADNVGGSLRVVPSGEGLFAKSIAFSLSDKFGSANSIKIKTAKEEPAWSSVVAFGCFKKKSAEKIGFYDERMKRSQDLDFNLRLKKAGGKVLLVPKIKAFYYAKSKLSHFFLHNFNDGIWISYPLKFKKRVFLFRHLVPLFFVSGLIGSLVVDTRLFLAVLLLYFGSCLYFSSKIALREKDARFLISMPIVFFARHLGYGLGSLFGFFKILWS